MYRKIENGSPLLSSQNTDHRGGDNVEVGQTASAATVSPDDAPKDRFFERLGEHWHRFKRGWFEDFGLRPTALPATEKSVEKAASVRRGDDIETNDLGGLEDDEDEEDDEDDQNSHTTAANGFFSGDGETMTSEKSKR